MKLKIDGGTPNHSTKSLCFNCTYAHVFKGHAESDINIRCGAFFDNSIWINRPIYECDRHERPTDSSLRDMKEIAWILMTKKGRPVGFTSSTEAKEKINSGQADKLTPKHHEVEIGDE